MPWLRGGGGEIETTSPKIGYQVLFTPRALPRRRAVEARSSSCTFCRSVTAAAAVAA